MSAAPNKFADSVLACVEDVNALLPDLAARYPGLVMVTALAEHIGGALRLCIRNDTCTPEQARYLLEHLHTCAFNAAAN